MRGILVLCIFSLISASCQHLPVLREPASEERPAKTLCSVDTDDIGFRLLRLWKDNTTVIKEKAGPIASPYTLRNAVIVFRNGATGNFLALGIDEATSLKFNLLKNNDVSTCLGGPVFNWPDFPKALSSIDTSKPWHAFSLMKSEELTSPNPIIVLKSQSSYFNPTEMEPGQKGRIAVARLVSFYAHEHFHMAQNRAQARLLKTGDDTEARAIQEKYIFGEEEFCAAISKPESPFSVVLWSYWLTLNQLTQRLADGGESQTVESAIRDLKKIIQGMRRDFPREFNFLKNWEYIEGGAEFAGQRAALASGEYSMNEAVRFQLGYGVDNEFSGNDILYRSGAIAGLLAEYLDLTIQFSNDTWVPLTSWWEKFILRWSSSKPSSKPPLQLGNLIQSAKSMNQEWSLIQGRYCSSIIH